MLPGLLKTILISSSSSWKPSFSYLSNLNLVVSWHITLKPKFYVAPPPHLQGSSPVFQLAPSFSLIAPLSLCPIGERMHNWGWGRPKTGSLQAGDLGWVAFVLWSSPRRGIPDLVCEVGQSLYQGCTISTPTLLAWQKFRIDRKVKSGWETSNNILKSGTISIT